MELTVAEMKRICKMRGKHQFDEETMKFWGSEIIREPNKYGLYIESVDNFFRTAKIYNLKAFDCNTGEVVTLNAMENEEFKTLEQADEMRDYITSEIDKQRQIWFDKESKRKSKNQIIIDNFGCIKYDIIEEKYYVCDKSGVNKFEFQISDKTKAFVVN